MIKYNLLIIDDELSSRREGYEKVLGMEYFNLSFIESASPSELQKIKKSSHHGIVLDVNLDDWSGSEKGDLFKEIAKLISTNTPVFLVSSAWNKDSIKWVNSAKDDINIRYYLSWNDDIQLPLKKGTNFSYSAIRENIKRELDEIHANESIMVGEDESIFMLQISDLQFGDPDFDDDSKLLQRIIPSYLAGKNITVHLIAAVGDIVYSGLPSEYKVARNFFQKLCPELLGDNYKSRLLLVPGNHDVNLRLNAADLYKFDFKTKKLSELPDNKSNEHHAYGLTPYKEFAYDLTSNPAYLGMENHLNFINDRFLNWGLRFYHLNSVSEQNYNNPDKASIPEDFLDQLLANSALPDKVTNIVLSHHDPDSFGFASRAKWGADWSVMSKFIQTAGIDLYLHGHRHQFHTYLFINEGAGLDNIRMHMTGTMSLGIKSRVPESERGFSILEFPRKKGVIQTEEIIVTDYEITKGMIKEICAYNLHTVKPIIKQ